MDIHLTVNQPRQKSVSVNSLVLALSGSDPTPSPASPLPPTPPTLRLLLINHTGEFYRVQNLLTFILVNDKAALITNENFCFHCVL